MSIIEEKLELILQDLQFIKKQLKIVPDRDITVKDFESSISGYEEFAREELKLEQNTINNQKSAILAYLKHCNGIINKETVKAYLDSNESNSWKTNQVKALRKYIRDFLKLGNWINEFKFLQTKIKTKKEIPSNEEIAQFCDALPSLQTQLAFMMLFNSGLREGEVLSLRIADINDDTNMIDASNIHKGKTKFSWYSFITKQTAKILYDYQLSDEIEITENEDEANNTKLFNISSRTLQQTFKTVSDTIGMQITPRLLRTVFAERCREAGIDKEYIDAFCGRIPKGTLEKHYTDYSPEALRKQYDKVESYLIL